MVAIIRSITIDTTNWSNCTKINLPVAIAVAAAAADPVVERKAVAFEPFSSVHMKIIKMKWIK